MEANVVKLAERCLPEFGAKGVGKMTAIKGVCAKQIAGVWTGEGGIVEVTVQGNDGQTCSFIAKNIGSYKNLRDEGALVDHMSYYNELCFYETELPDKMCGAGALCPRPLYVDRQPSGLEDRTSRVASPKTASRLRTALRTFRVKPEPDSEEKDEGIICMTRLTGSNWRPSRDKTEAALTWLARLHALFWGGRADAAVAAGVSDQACFWHLDNRHLELARMDQKSPLRLAAVGIDARLKADGMQTMCHGDPKGANIMWDEDTGLSMYDFQWFGKAPPTKDLAYFFATAAFNGRRDFSKAAEEACLRFYHSELCKILEAQGDATPSFEYLCTSYMLAVCDYHRWIEGGFCWGNMDLIEAQTEAFFEKLAEGGAPKSEEEYQAKIFELFPP